MLTGGHSIPLHVIIYIWIALLVLVNSRASSDFVQLARQARKEAELKVRVANKASLSRFAAVQTSDGFAARVESSNSHGRKRRRRPISAAEKLSKVHGSRFVSPDFFDKSRIFQLAANLYLQRIGSRAESVQKFSDRVNGFRKALSGLCSTPPSCDPYEPYRSADGTCNNLFYTLQGSQSTPQPRYLYAAYNDTFQLYEPRAVGVYGQSLPSARFVSNQVHRGTGAEIAQPDVTLFLMQWGQFTDHDIVLTPTATEQDGTSIECCIGGVPKPSQHPECYHITLPGPPTNAPNDPHFPSTYSCLHFVRSVPAISSECLPGQRQQLNRVTSYIDASNVYGSTREEQDSLRTKIGGRLKTRGNNLPEDPSADCELSSDPVDYCLKAGDERVMEQPSLSMIHTAFMREHNRIAGLLAAAKPTWNDETLFQETRKIVAAEMQHITYNEYLPIILGDYYMNFFELYSTENGFNTVYNSYIDASIVNVFAAATFRYGHSQVPNELKKNDLINGLSFSPRQLEDTFFKPNMILRPSGADRLARYVATANSHAIDSRIEESVRDKLFKNTNNPLDSLDLAALNIQRGRDHGLPPYNDYRVLCGLDPYLTWVDAVDHSPADILKLRHAYSDPRDIDMFTGALSEQPIPGGLIGPTNACILGNQFRALKRGDRFFYENPFPITGFTLAQLNSIKTTTLARIICKNMNTPLIQRKIFRKVGYNNPLQNCENLPDIDINGFWSGFEDLGQQGKFKKQKKPGPQVLFPASSLSGNRTKKIPKFLVPSNLRPTT